jgi:hypothetical protein
MKIKEANLIQVLMLLEYPKNFNNFQALRPENNIFRLIQLSQVEDFQRCSFR